MVYLPSLHLQQCLDVQLILKKCPLFFCSRTRFKWIRCNATFKNCGIGVKKMTQLYKQPNLKTILRTSIVILVAAETACILTAETIDLIFYRHSLFISIPLSLLVGA